MKFYFQLQPAIFFFFFAFALSAAPSQAQDLGFGSNKVRYHTDHHWKILETAHFQIYYYEKCETLARTAADDAEKAFIKTCQAFDFVPRTKIPLFVYATPMEFEETNITPEILQEGVGGFTEVFKNRIAVPMDGSYHEFEKVIHHELTHAFQYDLIYGEGWRSVNLFKAVFVPNWMMEGMAEWNAQHLDGQGEMVLRDAILNDQVMPLSLMESFDHFEQVYVAYKESQSLLDYVTQVYGNGKVVQIFKRMAANQPSDTAIKNVLGISLDQLYNNWHFYMKSQTWARINGMPSPERYGDSVGKDVAKAAVSPDGKKIAMLKAGELDLYDVTTKKIRKILTRHFATQGSGLTWSPDGNFLAFAASLEGEYGLYSLEIKNSKLSECPLTSLPMVYSPAWSPDQRYIIFSGFDYKTVDLYRYELVTKHVERLTDNQASESWASYSEDQKFIYYISEEDGNTQIEKVALGDNGLPQGQPVTIGKGLGTISSFRLANNIIYFTSNRDKGIFNLFKMSFNGDSLIQLTHTFADVLNISLAPDQSVFYATLYQHSKENLYAYPAGKLENDESPSLDLKYTADSFETAGKIIPEMTVKDTAKDFELPVNSDHDRDEPEVISERKQPTQPPATVTHLEVSEATNLVQLQWPISNADADSIDSYKIYRSTSAGARFSYLATTSNIKQGRYVDYDVQNNGTYFYYVTAVNKAGESNPSPIAEVHPSFEITSTDYHLTLSPDILLFLAGYDSSFGFVGGGIAQMSDYLGDHRLGILGDTIPGVRTGVEANYEFSQWRTTVDLDLFYYQNYFNIYDLQSGDIVNQYRNNENGFSLNFSYPLNTSTRFEYGVGTQRFLGSPVYLQFSEGISNYSLNTDQWNVANYYRLSFVQDKRKGTQFWPSSGYALNFTLLHALPILDYNVSFANVLFETQAFADIGFLNHLVWANRFVVMTSQGPNPQTFFIGDDAPFQAYFTTIRGYGGNTFFGNNLGLLNTELRYPIATNMNFIPQPLSFFLIKDIELAAFMDAGVVSDQLQDLSNSQVLSSIGTGIRFYTFLYQRALVMFRFDVAWRLDQSLPPTFHFNLAPMF
jgi:hypothetical protein